jgi:hypothetical protein
MRPILIPMGKSCAFKVPNGGDDLESVVARVLSELAWHGPGQLT